MIGGFLAYFHAIAHVVGNLVLAAICAVITATRLVVGTGDVSLTVASTLIVAALSDPTQLS